MKIERKPVKTLPPEVARKIAAGEVIDRPNAIVRELLDNAVDSGADSITAEIVGGGIERIRIVDNGSGMTREDLENCARPHATSKITAETDLLNLSTLGFRGEALSSVAAVSRLQITSACEGSAWHLEASVTRDHVITPADLPHGTVVQSEALFENFPARRMFLKRPAAETLMCRQTFVEKALPRTDISFRLIVDGKQKLDLPKNRTLSERFTSALDLQESPALFYELHRSADTTENGTDCDSTDNNTRPDWKFTIIIGEPAVSRADKKLLFVYVNGRRINEYSLLQAIEYGAQGYFPNGTHPAAALFLEINPALVDFNIHPAKREARFKDIAPIHRAVSAAVRDFFRNHTVANLASQAASVFNMQPELESLSQNTAPDSQASHFLRYEPGKPYKTRKTSAETQAAAFYSRSSQTEQDSAQSHINENRHLFFRDSFCEQEINQTESICTTGSNLQRRTLCTEQAAYTKSAPQYIASASGIKYIGSVLGVFLAAEKDGFLYLIDQHAAHERILYNEFIAEAGQKQPLLVPYVIETASVQDDEYLHCIKEQLTQAGFEAQDCGGGRWEFNSVPVQWKGTERDLSADLLTRRLAPEELTASLAATNACRAAVKDGDILDCEAAQRLTEQAFALSDPHCPHGRPIWKKLSKEELFEAVKRT